MDEPEQYLTGLTMKKLEVFGFRGRTQPVSLELDRHANFLIGRNGTGKTTLINIISDVLACRYQSLMSAPFDGLTLVFAHTDRRHKPFLEVKKVYDTDGDVVSIDYSFTDYKTKGPSFVQTLKSRYYRRNDELATSIGQRRIQQEFQKRFKFTWLALNRSSGISRSSTDNSNDLDFRLEHSLQRLGTYFTTVDTRFSAELQKFQQEWFLSLLVSSRNNDVLSQARKFDLDEEGRQIKEMLAGIGIQPQQYASKVDRHIATAKRILERSTPQNLDQYVENIADIYDITRLHHWVEQWKELQERKKPIYLFKSRLFDIANQMLFNKRLEADAGNKIVVRRRLPEVAEQKRAVPFRFDEISLTALSSGEKQLLIFLSETVLKAEHSYIFIADEPELSLHVEWQERLVPVILELSPQAQIFFATHSPDIVNRFQENVFSMEEIAV